MSVSEVDPEDSDEIEQAAVAAKKHGMAYPCLLDADGAWMASVGIKSLPAFMLVDGNGLITTLFTGKLLADSAPYKKLSSSIEKSLR